MLQVGLNKRDGTYHSLFGLLVFFLFLPLRLDAQKVECGLPHTTEEPPSQSLQRIDRGCADTEHKSDPIGPLLALVNSPVAGVQPHVQPAEAQQVPLRILRRARKPGHDPLVRGKGMQAH